jgi:hypothetical protein
MNIDYAKLKTQFAQWPDFDKQLDELIAQHQLSEEHLTKEQFAHCIKQMIAAGDFTRYVRVDNQAQQVIYEPYNRCMDLEMQVEKLKATVAELQNQLACYV